MNHMVKKILVVEDEDKILEVVKSFLESKGFTVLTAPNGRIALDIFEQESIGLVLLDLMLPEISGEEVCRTLRKKSRVPIIMLTAKSQEEDLLQGLGLGADDYITKPFGFKTLYARIEAVLRRSEEDLSGMFSKKSFCNGDLVIDYSNRYVSKAGREVRLTPNEYKLLVLLAGHPNKVFTREDLIAVALGEEFEGYDRTIDSHIKNLRQKIESDPKNPRYVKTIHGVGYRFDME